MEQLYEFAHEYNRPRSELDNWLYENEFDFWIEVQFLIDPML